MSEESDFHLSDDDIDDTNHNKIVENVLSLNKAQHLKKPSRTEPTLQISEFNLVNSITGQKGSVQIDELTKLLGSKKKHSALGKKIDAIKKKSHTLPKPLEKPQADRIRRSVGYEKNRFLLDRWEAFVTSKRAEVHQVFPLTKPEKLTVDDVIKDPFLFDYKTSLEKELDKITATNVETYHIEDETEKDGFSLTLQELKDRRQEVAKLRARQSYKEAKARRQNKIKSKKYHRILRKEKIKQKLKEFDELMKTDPEEALKKLGEIEKARALERFSLRHKGTGQWARSKQFRAKYDKESRQVLAQQLQISRELTRKQKVVESSDSEGDEAVGTEVTSKYELPKDNPWFGPRNTEILQFVNDYTKTLEEEARLKKDLEKETELKYSEQQIEETTTNKSVENHSQESNEKVIRRKSIDTEAPVKEVIMEKPEKSNKNTVKKKRMENNTKHDEAIVKAILKSNKKGIKNKSPTKNEKVSTKKKLKMNLNNSSGEWDIEDLFEDAEKHLENKVKNKAAQKQEKIKPTKKIKKSKTNTRKNKKIDLSFPNQSKKHFIDEPMLEEALGQNHSESSNNINVLKDILSKEDKIIAQMIDKEQNISTEKHFKLRDVLFLDSAESDMIIEDENTEESNQADIDENTDNNNHVSMMVEAFEDTDIANDFTKDKQDEVNKDKPQTIDLNLPGWGSWAGTGINPNKQRKRKRFIVKMPEVLPRRDDNKGSLIINEKAASKIKSHLVSEIPFPFKSVKDYEASIRAPIGTTFVTEQAHRKLIRPAVHTKMGAIIEPVSLSVLMGKPKKHK